MMLQHIETPDESALTEWQFLAHFWILLLNSKYIILIIILQFASNLDRANKIESLLSLLTTLEF